MEPIVFPQTDVDVTYFVEQTCPKCQQVLWSRPNAAFICARCYNDTRRLVLLNPTGEEIPYDVDFITWEVEDLATLDLVHVQVPPIKDPTSNKRYSHTSAKVEV